MTRTAAIEVKRDDDASNRISSDSYSDDDEASQETEVSNASDSCSDLNEFDKNNNSSPPSQHLYFARFECEELFLQSNKLDTGNISINMSRRHREDELTRQSYDAVGTSTDTYSGLSNDSYSSARFLEDEVFLQTQDDALAAIYSKDPELSPIHGNANENNNSNRKRFRNMNTASYNLQNKNDFRNKMHSVKLSSVRASRGKYKGNRILPYKERMICRNGASNVRLKKFGKLDSATRYSKDIFTTLIDLSWTWVILLTALVYVGHWFIFGLMYWLFAVLNDDFTKIFGAELAENATNLTIATLEEGPCVSGVYDFASAFLFSMESETTIGYGSRTIGTSCKGAITLLVIQCVISAIFDTWVIGMCFSRMARPDARCNTILYSKNAVVCTRDGKKCLIVRVANLRKSLLLSVSCRARIITLRAPLCKEEEEEGHQFMLEQKEITFENANITMLTAPVEYCHVIDKDSPLYSIPSRYLSSDTNKWFEIVIILNGIVEATGMTVHAQTSYLNTEIKYRHRLVPVISLSPKKDRYIVDFDMFHHTEKENLEIAQLSRRNKKSFLLDGKFDALVEESDEFNEMEAISSKNCEKLENNCVHCGRCTFGDNNMNSTCVCNSSTKIDIKNHDETTA